MRKKYNHLIKLMGRKNAIIQDFGLDNDKTHRKEKMQSPDKTYRKEKLQLF